MSTPPPHDPAIDAFLERVPAEHRHTLRLAVEQWAGAMWLAAHQLEHGGAVPAAADPVSAPMLRVYSELVATMCGTSAFTGPGEAHAPERLALARAFGELAGTLARLACEAIGDVGSPAGQAPPPATVRALYDSYVEAWEARYADWMASEAFARLQGELCNAALALRVARRTEHDT